MNKNKPFAGCDYGAKSQRTTALAYSTNHQLLVDLVPKKSNPDNWIYNTLIDQGIQSLFLDAPLSLPKIYFDPSDILSTYHYRVADLELKAMSPMFLGGLTARAMTLAHRLKDEGILCYETYPKAVKQYRFEGVEDPNAVLAEIEATCELEIVFNENPPNDHQIDAVLAWFAGWHANRGHSITFGRECEGVITV